MALWISVGVAMALVLLMVLQKRKLIVMPVDRSILEENEIEKNTLQKRERSTTWGEFHIVGYHHLPENIKRIVWKELKEDDSLLLEADPANTHDPEAIKVFYEGQQIGWIAKDYYRKKELLTALQAGKETIVKCIRNSRKSSKNGMTHIIGAKFEIKKP